MNARRKNFIQNLLIAVLSVSAVLLFVRTQVLSREGNAVMLSSLLSSSNGQNTDLPARLTDLAEPVRFAVTGQYGRWGDTSFTTADEDFSVPGGLLREALGSAGTPEACTQQDFRDALGAPSAYYDFRTDLPLAVIGALVGTDSDGLYGDARRLILSAGEEENASLFWTDGTACSRCLTRVSRADLAEVVSSYQLGSASFAFELDSAKNLAPYSLFLTGAQPAYPRLSAQAAAEDDAALFTALDFNPHTKSRYTDSGGEVVMDGRRTLRLQAGGAVVYDSGGEETVQIASAGDAPTEEELATGACRLLNALLNGGSGDAALYLSGETSGSAGRTLTFDYQVNGVPILRSAGHAAEVSLDGTTVTALTLYPRRYTLTGEDSPLLPLAQALAIADRYAGSELTAAYSDGGAAAVDAVWLAE